jgi:hypothetical protein
MSRPLLSRALAGVFDTLNRRVPWHRLPTWLGIPNLLRLRLELRAANLHDTWTPGALRRHTGPVPDPTLLRWRTPDGSWNDPEYPDMGKAGTRFGRNVPRHAAGPEPEPALLEPSPREVSRRLLARDRFRPAPTLNVLAAAWIQFQIHDWFDHGQGMPGDDDFRIDLAPDDGWAQCPMHVPRTPRDATRCADDGDCPPTYINKESHWWDGSAIYGSSVETMRGLRAHRGGRMRVEEGARLGVDASTGRIATGVTENWWVGLGLLHTLFTLEHNAVCERLERAHPDWSDEHLFQTARLVTSALMAKIHTVEWTPAITDHPTLHLAMKANWSGLANERLRRWLGPLGKTEVLAGVQGTPTDHHGTPFQLTEEFAAVYRLHPLIPDDLTLRRLASGRVLSVVPFRDALLERAIDFAAVHEVSAGDLWYSLGVANAGAVCLHNYPDFLRDFTRPDGVRIDLAAVDVLRDRERGVPRYNAFRRLFHLAPARSFEELTDNPEWARELREVYGDVERVDLMVGMFAETPPAGFGFSDTAFRVFVLMASRRLRSDRFFTRDFTPEVYSAEGMRWIAETSMKDVLIRHHPELARALAGVGNAFAPWPMAAGAA